MVNTNKLRGIIAEHRTTQREIAKGIGISPNTFCYKLKKGMFSSAEMEAMMSILQLSKADAMNIFFDENVS